MQYLNAKYTWCGQKCPFVASFTICYSEPARAHTIKKEKRRRRGKKRGRQRYGWGSLWVYARIWKQTVKFAAQIYLQPAVECRQTHKLEKMAICHPQKATGLDHQFWIHLFACLDFFSLLPWRLMLSNYHGQNFQLSSKWIQLAIIALICNKIHTWLTRNYHWTSNCFLIIFNMAGISAKGKGQYPKWEITMPHVVDDSSFTKFYFFKDLFLSSSLKSVFKYLCICNLHFSTPDMFETV